MKKFLLTLAAAAAMVLSTGCTRIATGEVGVRVDPSLQVQGTEILPGTWAQTVWGSVLTFPTKDIVLSLNDKRYQTSDNSALADFDVTVVYSLSPDNVAELYSTKSKSFHAKDNDGDILLMYNYLETMVNNVAYKVVRGYPSLEVADKRADIEKAIADGLVAQLTAEGLKVVITSVQVRSILPNAEILQAATDYVKARNQVKVKEEEVKVAEAEARRMKALAENGNQSIAYMQAQADMLFAQAAKEGKINTIIVPRDFRGQVVVGAK